MAQPTIQLKRKLSANALEQAATFTAEPCIVFLAGPYIDPDDPATAATKPSANLRYHLFHGLNGQDIEVSLGEYRQLLLAHEEALGAHNNAAVAEITHARDVATMVVIIVDSPGSFAEIGAFSMDSTICSKMLILSDPAHKDGPGYVSKGPIPAAVSQGAKIEYVETTDIESAQAKCMEFIRGQLQLSRMKRLLRG